VESEARLYPRFRKPPKPDLGPLPGRVCRYYCTVSVAFVLLTTEPDVAFTVMV
jgi:hypothetical protein